MLSCGARLLLQLAFLQSLLTNQNAPGNVYVDCFSEIEILSQAVQLYMVRNNNRRSYFQRDRFMADNVQRIVDRGGKVAVWAHNGHIGCRQLTYGINMGSHLRKAFGDRYYALGMTFFKGSFRLFHSQTELPEFCIAMPPPGNIEHVFHQSGIPRFLLDLRTLEEEPDVHQWWSQPHTSQGIGVSFFNSKNGELCKYRLSSNEYDGVVYFNQTSSSRPL